jgi:hypothetical protein
VSENLSDAANDYSSQKLGPAPKVQAQGDATTPSCLGNPVGFG